MAQKGSILHQFRGTITFKEDLSNDNIRTLLGNDKFTALASAPDPEGRFLLHDEFREQQPNDFLITELLKFYPDRAERRNGSGDVPLHIACLNIENVEPGLFLQLLRAYPEGPSVQNNMGNLPLHKAVAVPSVEAGGNDLFCVRQRNLLRRITLVLEAFPESISMKNREGQIPLHVALTKPKSISLSVVSLLIEYYPEGAMEVDAYGHLPLHKSVQPSKRVKCCPQAVELLLDLFPEGVRIQDKRGFLPLHWASIHEKPHLEILSILLAVYPEGTQVRDHDGMKPVDRLYKHENHCRDAVRMLIETGERVRRGELGKEHPLPDDLLMEGDEEEEEEEKGGGAMR